MIHLARNHILRSLVHHCHNDLVNSLRSLTVLLCVVASTGTKAKAEFAVLAPKDFSHHVEKFNENDEEDVVNLVPNGESWNWMVQETPLFECPAPELEEAYYFRWWTFRKHLKETPDGFVFTEFILPVGHAGPFNTISCAYGHQVTEGRWLKNQRYLDDYTHYWFRKGPDGGRQQHFHKFSSWAAAALYDRYLVDRDREFITGLLDELVEDYYVWESERQQSDGMFWQYDVRDGMEESISGGRRVQNTRPTINSYMAANARAISLIAKLAGRSELAEEFQTKFQTLQKQLNENLWDEQAKFFKVRMQDGPLSSAREAIGFIPWTFRLAKPEHAIAWNQLVDEQGFNAPKGITTAERRHPEFRSHGVGTCEWDGAVWPFATSQTLTGLSNMLREQEQPFVTVQVYFDELLKYARAHQREGKPYIGEYHDELTGEWLITGKKERRSRFYNHSTFNDLVISGLVGVVPRADNILEIEPLVPADAWDWFCLDSVPYHGHEITVLWDRQGDRYHRGKGFVVLVDGQEIARAESLTKLEIELPK